MKNGFFVRKNEQWWLACGPFIEVPKSQRARLSIEPETFYLTVQRFYDLAPQFLRPSQVKCMSNDELQKWIQHSRGGLAINDGATQIGQRRTKSKHQKLGPQSSGSQSFFATLFEASMAKIRAGDLQKAVPWSFWDSEESFSPILLLDTMQALVAADSHLFPYGFWQTPISGSEGQTCGCIGLSPEVLFSRKGMEVNTMAVAGTQPKGTANKNFGLQATDKLKLEHQLVIQDISTKLSTFGAVKVAPSKLIVFKNFLHEKSEIYLQLNESTDVDFRLLQALHPTAALGVAPSAFGTLWMSELESEVERGYFGAPIGFSSKNEALAVVAIRGWQWWKGSVKIYAGCGITGESNFELEWQEVCAKIRATHEVLTAI